MQLIVITFVGLASGIAPLAEKTQGVHRAPHKERSLYKTVCDQCRETIRSEAGTPPLFARIAVDIESHYAGKRYEK